MQPIAEPSSQPSWRPASQPTCFTTQKLSVSTSQPTPIQAHFSNHHHPIPATPTYRPSAGLLLSTVHPTVIYCPSNHQNRPKSCRPCHSPMAFQLRNPRCGRSTSNIAEPQSRCTGTHKAAPTKGATKIICFEPSPGE